MCMYETVHLKCSQGKKVVKKGIIKRILSNVQERMFLGSYAEGFDQSGGIGMKPLHAWMTSVL